MYAPVSQSAQEAASIPLPAINSSGNAKSLTCSIMQHQGLRRFSLHAFQPVLHHARHGCDAVAVGANIDACMPWRRASGENTKQIGIRRKIFPSKTGGFNDISPLKGAFPQSKIKSLLSNPRRIDFAISSQNAPSSRYLRLNYPNATGHFCKRQTATTSRHSRRNSAVGLDRAQG